MKCMFSMALAFCAILSGLPLSAATMATCEYIWPAQLPPQTSETACFTTSPDGSTASAHASSGWGTYGPTVSAGTAVNQTSPIWAPDAHAFATYDADLMFTFPQLEVAGPVTVVPLLYVDSMSGLPYESNAFALASLGPVTISTRYIGDHETTLLGYDPFSIPLTLGTPFSWHLHLEARADGKSGSSFALFQGFQVYANGSRVGDFDTSGKMLGPVPEPSTAALVLPLFAALGMGLWCRRRSLSKRAA